MGCFSFKCKKSRKAVNSSSFTGDKVHLFLLKDGKPVEYMFGNYDSYGRVFSDKGNNSFEWKMDWHDVCNLMFSSDKSNGIAAILDKHYDGEIPKTRSEDDPNQGWGRERDIEWVENPIHKIY
jgi:hypothetical protein